MIFNLFKIKRTKIEPWEILLIRNIITQLPTEYKPLIDQIDEGLFNRILIDASDIPDYNAFTFNPNISQKYEKKNEQDYKIDHIRVYDKKTSSYLKFAIYVSSGTISGYSLDKRKKYEIDMDNIDTSNYKKEYLGFS